MLLWYQTHLEITFSLRICKYIWSSGSEIKAIKWIHVALIRFVISLLNQIHVSENWLVTLLQSRHCLINHVSYILFIHFHLSVKKWTTYFHQKYQNNWVKSVSPKLMASIWIHFFFLHAYALATSLPFPPHAFANPSPSSSCFNQGPPLHPYTSACPTPSS